MPPPPAYTPPKATVLKMPENPVSRRRLEGDWFAMDSEGRVALFCGGDQGPIPPKAEPEVTMEALRAMDTAQEMKRDALRGGDNAYRGSSFRQEEPVFDPPRRMQGRVGHEQPFEGYPHLVFAHAENAIALREIATDVETRDALSREGSLALFFPALGNVLHEAIHEKEICAGCRVLDLPDDPRLRAPEVVATSGLYVYAYPERPHDAPAESQYYRVVSPTAAADVADLEPLVVSVAEKVRFPFRFEDSLAISVPEDLLTAAAATTTTTTR